LWSSLTKSNKNAVSNVSFKICTALAGPEMAKNAEALIPPHVIGMKSQLSN